jgi:hypothetical protein
MDGTFRIVPSEFQQLLVLMVYDPQSKLFIPVFYALVDNKKWRTYRLFLQSCLDVIGEMDVETVNTDYELAEMKAAKAVFPKATRTVRTSMHAFVQTWKIPRL